MIWNGSTSFYSSQGLRSEEDLLSALIICLSFNKPKRRTSQFSYVWWLTRSWLSFTQLSLSKEQEKQKLFYGSLFSSPSFAQSTLLSTCQSRPSTFAREPTKKITTSRGRSWTTSLSSTGSAFARCCPTRISNLLKRQKRRTKANQECL